MKIMNCFVTFKKSSRILISQLNSPDFYLKRSQLILEFNKNKSGQTLTLFLDEEKKRYFHTWKGDIHKMEIMSQNYNNEYFHRV